MLLRLFSGLLGLAAFGGAKAVSLPEDQAEAMIHLYQGGGITASGPAVLVRKSIADRVSLSGQVYVDMVSNASIDVVTTASPYKETRTAYNLGLDYVYRDSQVSVGLEDSREPDYTAKSLSVDVAQEVFGGMTTVNLGFSRGADDVRKHNEPTFQDVARHWQYRLGATQILTPKWLLSLNGELIADDGFLSSPYRVARVFGAAVPERDPRTRTSRAVKLGTIGDVGNRTSVRAEYRYFWDTWAIKAHTVELGTSHYFGDLWLADAFFRYYKQNHALFYSDNATAETTYVSRDRRLSTFTSPSLGAKVTYTAAHVPGKYDIRLSAEIERKRFNYSDFTDLRTGGLYTSDASVVQLFVNATY
jgi:hypothetical protein